MRKILKVFTLIGAISTAILLMTGCGAITGLNSEVKFDSKPQGADVILNNQTMGKTPIKLKLKNDTDYNVVLRYSGYADYNAFVDSDISAGAIVTDIIFLGGVVGIVVDAITGGFYKNKKLNEKTLLYDFTIGKQTIKAFNANDYNEEPQNDN